jgi:hypothetical protein
MLNIPRIRPCEYNKSCSILHHKSNKIEVAFFWIFYDFLRILQVSAKGQTLFKNRLSQRSLEVSADSQPYPYFAQNTLEISQTLQCSPRTHGGGGLAGIRQLRRRPWPGKGRREARGSPHIGLRVWSGWRRCRQAGAPATGGEGRCGSCCGAGAARPRQGAALAGVRGSGVNARGNGFAAEVAGGGSTAAAAAMAQAASWRAVGEGGGARDDAWRAYIPEG